eukprot:TRINITY_DN10261_c0_g1_i4.p3 TRINITY_DN10261_c0_g1~~TRINITY_DN10261_c0_g1_i4.p3  ORF type:complete len:118 (-),score=47.51 TRINITY_DN10261_c0_g1_i4:95-448(-)
MLGNSGPEKFKIPYIFSKLYVDWANKWGFDGYLIDAEFKGDDDAFVAFLKVFGEALHASNKSLGVFLYPEMGKAKYINDLGAVDHWLGTVSYTHLRAHETPEHLVCRLLLEKKKKKN